MNEKIPETQEGIEAQRLADKMLLYIKKDAWDKTNWLKFQASGKTKYIWDKSNNLVQVVWKDYEALIHTPSGKGIVYEENQELKGERKEKFLKKARDNFNNDSFWFFAPFKINDPGTTISYKPINDSIDGLMVKYNSGGSTPGDSYLWAINQEGIPRYWQMWTSNIPIGGLTTYWKRWEPLNTGAQVARERKIWMMTLDFNYISSGNNFTDIGLESDPFKNFRNN